MKFKPIVIFAFIVFIGLFYLNHTTEGFQSNYDSIGAGIAIFIIVAGATLIEMSPVWIPALLFKFISSLKSNPKPTAIANNSTNSTL
jgi:hypothetical protein